MVAARLTSNGVNQCEQKEVKQTWTNKLTYEEVQNICYSIVVCVQCQLPENGIYPAFYLKIQSVPRSKHAASRL